MYTFKHSVEMYDEQTHDRNIYSDFIFVTHIIYVQCIDGWGIVRGGKKAKGEMSGWQKDGYINNSFTNNDI